MNPISETLLWGGIMTIYNLPGLLCATICLSRLNVAAEAVVIPAAVIACIGQVVLMMTAGLTAYGFPMFAFPVSAIVGLGASLIAKRLLSQQHAGGLR